MASELETSLRKAAEQIVHYVKDAATLTVETKYVHIGETGTANFDQAKPAARTVIRLDGDSDAVVPMRTSEHEGELVVDADLSRIHEQNVATAIDYRTRMMQALLTMFQTHLDQREE